MILLDTDSFTLRQFGHRAFLERHRSASEIPASTIVTQVEVLRGRQEALLKAEDGARLLHAQHGLYNSVQHLTLFSVIPFDAAAAAEFDRLRKNQKLKKIGRADLLISCISLANKAMLVSRNLKHFRLVPGLQLENWAD